MAAYLAWLKSRLLIPPEEAEGEEDAEALAGQLADRLAELVAPWRGAVLAAGVLPGWISSRG